MHAQPMTWNQAAHIDRCDGDRRDGRGILDPQTVFEAGLRHHHIANTAYPIHHSTTMRPYHVRGAAAQAAAIDAWQGVDRLGLYVHVPFCAARCRYCEYTVVEQHDWAIENRYFDALLREIEMYRNRAGTERRMLIGFDIGGGTPALVRVENLRRVVEAVRSAFQWQGETSGDRPVVASIETTPIVAAHEADKIAEIRALGIERISMGVQTTHFKLARSLGREYEGLSMLERAVRHIRDAGFKRFNIDLMYGFADQTLSDWHNTVAQTIALGPEYITLYQMRYKGTRLQEQAAQVSQEQVYAQEALAHGLLLAAGYAGSPGKNTYSKVSNDPGTSDYLTERVVKGTPYLGLGLGAQTFSPYTLSYNLGAASKTLESYLQAVDARRLPVQDLYHLPLEVAMAKMISVSFYFGEIHLAHFRAKFGVALEEVFGREVAFLLDRGLMHYVGPCLQLTEKGVQHKSGVIALFYAGAVKDYLISLEAGWDEAELKKAA